MKPVTDINLSRARAHVRTHRRATIVVPEAEGIKDAETLAESPWPQHQVEAGWVFLQLFMDKQIKKNNRGVELATRARTTWSRLLESQDSDPDTYVRSLFAICYIPLWTHLKKDDDSFNKPRKQGRQIEQFKKLEQSSLNALANTVDRDSKREVIGAMAEIISAGILNRSDLTSSRNRHTVPTQIWFDKNYNQSESNFDLWQVEGDNWHKIQIKARHSEVNDNMDYDNDIAVIFLEDHWPDTPIETIAQYLISVEADDPQITAVAESMQNTIDEHFREHSQVA